MALDLIDRIRGLRLNGAENFEVWLQERSDAEYSASLLIANAGLHVDTRAELEREATLLRRQANPPTSGARVWTRSDDRVSSASEVDDPRLAEAKAYDLIDRMRSLRLNGAAVGKDLHRERSHLLSQSHLLLNTASMRPATRHTLGTEVQLLEDLSDEVANVEPTAAGPEVAVVSEPEPEREPQPEPQLEAEADPQPQPGFWRRLSRRFFGR
jgi:hypothetical protein